MTVNDPEALSNRLLDFEDDSLKFVPSSNLDEPVNNNSSTTPWSCCKEAGANHGTALPSDNTYKSCYTFTFVTTAKVSCFIYCTSGQ